MVSAACDSNVAFLGSGSTHLSVPYPPHLHPTHPPLQSKKSECVKVVVRCRPMVEDEVAANYQR